ncbi:MAG: NAD-binding protein [Bacilli bacterium]|jgi:trk system potassium uptake protein TrkA|nr:NAD-binding protein [Bacilli bacterium]
MVKEKKMTVVIGSSRLGAAIASLNSDQGIYTAIIDEDEHSFRKLDSSYSGFKIVGNATDVRVLEKARIGNATEVDLCTGDDNTNLYLASVVLKFYRVPNIIVRLHDDTKKILIDDPRVTYITPSSLSFGMYKNLWDKEGQQ